MDLPRIAPLGTRHEADVVAGWIWSEWARHEPGMTRTASDGSVHAAFDGAPLPHYVVAHVGDELAGCAAIVADDLPTRPGLGPWLANVYVAPAYRGQGLGTALVERAMAHGATLADTLYLYTFGSTALYRRLGWRPHEEGEYAGQPIAILRFDAR